MQSGKYHGPRLSNWLLVSRQLFEQRFQPDQHLLGLLLFQRKLQHACRRELASRLAGDKARQALGIDGSFLGEANTDCVAPPLDLCRANAL